MNSKIAIAGLDYVGLPLAVAYGRKIEPIGYALFLEKIESYRRHVDPIGELSTHEMCEAAHLLFTHGPALLAEADFILIAATTPVDSAGQPDFSLLISASTTA